MPNTLYYGDNLPLLREYIPDESVDLIYLDPPFQSNRDYNILFREKDGSRAASQILAFEDTWEWNEISAAAYHEMVEGGGQASRVMQAFMTALGGNDMMAYLSMMAPRLVELRRVLKDTGSVYLHCDPTASHYLKILMDAVFGHAHFQNEIVWYYKGAGISPKRWGRRHDILLWYSKGDIPFFNPDPVRDEYAESTKERFSHYIGNVRSSGDFGEQELNPKGKHPDDVWQIPIVAPSALERLGYPTQKPEPLLERIILSSSEEGSVVLDPFCGCGTSVAVAQHLKRNWIGMDITHLAIGLIKHRLQDAYGGEAKYEVIGEPVSLPDAEELAKEDPYQFQWWAAGTLGGRIDPSERKKGADKGIDGRLYFHDDPKTGAKTKQVILSVKSGHIPASHIREIRGVLHRENAEIGVLITLQPPSKPMRAEAASAGFYTSPFGNKTHARIQIITIEEMLQGRRIDYPQSQANVTYRRARRYRGTAAKNQLLPYEGEEAAEVQPRLNAAVEIPVMSEQPRRGRGRPPKKK